MILDDICATILNESSSDAALSAALKHWVELCSAVTGVCPDPSFDAWAGDTLLPQGVAINPQAAAHCALDYMRSVMFMRGIYAAIKHCITRAPNGHVEILYAGCGPYATLLLPLLKHFKTGTLRVYLLDIHETALHSVNQLLRHFDLDEHVAQTIRADACSYQSAVPLDIIIAETMQKSLEQEPQISVTANLAAQLANHGVFIPERIDVCLCLADLSSERELVSLTEGSAIGQLAFDDRRTLATLCTLTPESVAELAPPIEGDTGLDAETVALFANEVIIPPLADLERLETVLFTRICVFQQYCLGDYESQITLPLKCHDLTNIAGGERYRVSYGLGRYPKFNFERIPA